MMINMPEERLSAWHYTAFMVKSSTVLKAVRISQDGSAAEGRQTAFNLRRSCGLRAGARLVDERTGVAYDYTRKGGVVHTVIILPVNEPGRYNDRQTLWNS